MTLTTALALLGAAVLLALLAHGVWSTRRAAARKAAPGGGAERIEPALDAPTLPQAEVDAAEADAALLASPLTASRTAALRVPRLDPLIDAIVTLMLEAPVSGEAALAHLPPTRRAGSKPFYVEGLDAAGDAWEPLAPGRRYRELQAGVQLASRSGPLNEIEYSEFVQKVQDFADAVGAMADFPDMLEVAARARELDALAGPLDAQLSVTLRSNGVAWSVGYLQQSAGRHGFVPGAVPGRLVLPGSDEGAPPVLVLSFDAQAALADDPQRSAVRECVLTLDVPQTAQAQEPFPVWHRVATELADEMDATAVDDQGQPVTLHAYAVIGRELERLYRELEALDLAAGSPGARRLFG